MVNTNAIMSMLIVFMLAPVVTRHMPGGFKDEGNMTQMLQPWKRAFRPWSPNIRQRCGRIIQRRTYRRRYFDSSHTHTNDLPYWDTYFEDVPNPEKNDFEVYNPNMGVDDESNLNMYFEQNLDKYGNDVQNLGRNLIAGREMYQRISDDQDLDKILGIGYARRGAVPWQVNVRVKGEHVCGGSIINNFYIITSAHCLAGKEESEVSVVVGDYSRSKEDPDEQLFQAQNLILHENFVNSPGTRQYDIALIKIKPTRANSGILQSRTIQPVCLPTDEPHPIFGTRLLVSGWGYMDTGSKTKPDVLKRTGMTLTNMTTCKLSYNISDLPPDLFCAGSLNGQQDTCRGDDGGPVVYRNQGTYVLYGIIEASHGCELPNLPTLCTNVSIYVPWILEKINEFSSNNREGIIPPRPSRD